MHVIKLGEIRPITRRVVCSSVQAVYAQARSGKFAKKDFSALLDYACEIAEVSPPRLK